MESSSVRGVFSPSRLDSISMINCLQSLFKDYPSIKFTSINSDEQLGGYRVCFSEPESTAVLKKNQLSTAIWIYPLTTYLMVHGIGPKKTTMFERDLRDAINRKFGKVISVVKRKNDSSSVDDVDWRVEIDIPEFKGLGIFERELLNEMMLSLPNRNEEFKVTFWCRQCKKSGHFQHECSKRRAVIPETQENSNGEIDETQSNENHSTQSNSKSPNKKTDGTPEEYAKFPLEPTETYAEKIGREEILKACKLSNEKQKNNTAESSSDAGPSTNNNLLTDKEIKKEKDETQRNSEVGSRLVPKEENEDSSNQSNGTVSNDDEIQIIGVSNKSTPVKSPSHDSNISVKAETSNMEEASRSPPETRTENSIHFPPFFSTPGPSYESPAAARPRGAEVTTALSERLQDCINIVCDAGVLDRKTLDAFLIHVKKKSNPIRVALNYTPNAKGLKEQLQKILHMYYNTPQTGTKEDIQFIKWLNGLVERFDGTIPRKRKRNNQSNDEPANKK